MKILQKIHILGLSILLTSSFLPAMEAPPAAEDPRTNALKQIRTAMFFAALHPQEGIIPYDNNQIVQTRGIRLSLYGWESAINANNLPIRQNALPAVVNSIRDSFANPETIDRFITQYQDQLGSDALWNQKLREKWQEDSDRYAQLDKQDPQAVQNFSESLANWAGAFFSPIALKQIRAAMFFTALHPEEKFTPYDKFTLRRISRSLYDWENAITQNDPSIQPNIFVGLVSTIKNLFANRQTIDEFITQYQDQLGDDTLWNEELHKEWDFYRNRNLFSILNLIDDDTQLNLPNIGKYSIKEIKNELSKDSPNFKLLDSAAENVISQLPNFKTDGHYQRFLRDLYRMAKKYMDRATIVDPLSPFPARATPAGGVPAPHVPPAPAVSPSPLAIPAEGIPAADIIAAPAPVVSPSRLPTKEPVKEEARAITQKPFPKRRYTKMIAALATITGAGIVAARAKLKRYIPSISIPNRQTFNNARISATAAVQKHPYIAALVSAALIGSTAGAAAGYKTYKRAKKPGHF